MKEFLVFDVFRIPDIFEEKNGMSFINDSLHLVIHREWCCFEINCIEEYPGIGLKRAVFFTYVCEDIFCIDVGVFFFVVGFTRCFNLYDGSCSESKEKNTEEECKSIFF